MPELSEKDKAELEAYRILKQKEADEKIKNEPIKPFTKDKEKSFAEKIKDFFTPKPETIILDATTIAAQEVLREYRAKREKELKTELTIKNIEAEKKRIDEELAKKFTPKSEKIANANKKILDGVGKVVKAVIGNNDEKPKEKTTFEEKMKKIENFNKSIDSFSNALIGGNSNKDINFDKMLGNKKSSDNFEEPDIFGKLLEHERKGKKK